jgi:hypothetical protein
MKNLKIYGLLVVAIMLFSTCKKDYPDDIPQWVKDKICYCKKKKNDCKGLEITEYSFNGTLYYRLNESAMSAPRRNDYYDNNENNVCSDPVQIGNPSCPFFSNGNLLLTRNIWRE